MWSHRNPDRPRDPRPTDSWNYTPLLRQARRVLVIIDLTQVQYLVTARHSDAMQITTCDALPTLGRLEEYALFTYSFLVAPAETQILTVETILSYTSQHIKNTWGVYLEPASVDLRWSDSTGDMFIIRNHQILIDLLRAHRPHWTEGQDLGILFNTIKDFENPDQPYIMRLSCHQALPNPNMLPWSMVAKKWPIWTLSVMPIQFWSSCLSLHVLFS